MANKTIKFKCPLVGKKEVILDVDSQEEKKGLFGTKILSQQVLRCDLQSMGGCNQKLDAFDTKCPAVGQASKCVLK